MRNGRKNSIVINRLDSKICLWQSRFTPLTSRKKKALLDFLESRHYNYKSTEETEMADSEFLDQYNKELAEAEAQIDAGDFLTHDAVKKFFADKRKRAGGS